MQYLNAKAVRKVFKGRKQISQEALQTIDHRIGVFLEKLASEPREKRINEDHVNFYKA
jgi:hypothetical protein